MVDVFSPAERAATTCRPRGPFSPDSRDLVLVVATGPPAPHALDDALADGGAPLAPRARAAPEEPGPIGEAHVREIDDRVHRLHRHVGADLHPLGLVTVAEEAGSSPPPTSGEMPR